MTELTFMHGQIAYQVAEMIDERINVFNGEAFCADPDHAAHRICTLTGFMSWVADHYRCQAPADESDPDESAGFLATVCGPHGILGCSCEGQAVWKP